MESLPGYDKWKTTPPDDGPEGNREGESCDDCGGELDGDGDCGRCARFYDHIDNAIDAAREAERDFEPEYGGEA